MKIFLIGLPGSGKTTIGKELALLVGKPFIDLDEKIVKRENLSIKKIFELKGESQFRLIESDVLRECIEEHDSFVMSTGGGTPAYHGNMMFMNEQGITIFLNTSPELIESRLRSTKIGERPLFSGAKNVGERLQELLTSRLDFYREAKLEVDGAISASELLSALPRR
jgi:shikimate kinase